MRERKYLHDVARKRDPDTLYKFPDQILTAVDVLDQFVEEKTVREILDELAETKANLAALEGRVGYFVRNAGAKSLEEVVVIHPKKEYTIVTPDEKGYIKGSEAINQKAMILPGQPTPEGIRFGYYKVEENKIVEDSKLKMSIYRIM